MHALIALAALWLVLGFGLAQASAVPVRAVHAPWPMSPAGRDLIVRFEVGEGERAYVRCCERPTWPGAASGVTIGIGYDLGHQPERAIIADWRDHAAVARLAAQAGITGAAAKARVPALRDIRVPYAYAISVFDASTLPLYQQRALRAFPGIERMPAGARDAVVSVVYNRGGDTRGERRREMRHIAEVCIPARDAMCVAEQIESMERIWRGSVIERGMTARRRAEADLARSGR